MSGSEWKAIMDENFKGIPEKVAGDILLTHDIFSLFFSIDTLIIERRR